MTEIGAAAMAPSAEVPGLMLSTDDEAALPAPVALQFDAVYAEHFDFVWRNLRRLGVRDGELRDAAQDAFLVVHRRLATFDGIGSVRAWLYSIVRRVASDSRRSRRRKELVEPAPAESIADPRGREPERDAMQQHALRQLLQLLAQLDEDKREVLILCDLEEMSAKEAGESLGLNLNTVYSRLRAARQELRLGLEHLQRVGRQP